MEEVVNCSLSVVDGISKRPPAEHIANLDVTGLTDAKLHVINRDTQHRYIVVITDGDLRVFDLQGNEKTVSFPSGKAYLESAAARKGFACVTVADFTFIINKNVTVEMDDVGADLVSDPSTYWWMNRAQTSDSLTTVQQKQYDTNPPVAGFGYRGPHESVASLNETTTDFHEGDTWKIVANSENKFSTFYVRYTDGILQETVAPQVLYQNGLKNKIKASTMPHALVDMGDGTFSFGPFSWAPRHVGDESTNPNPTFVGRKIRGVFFYKNRLCFLSDENIIGSRTGDYGNFYRLTVTQTLDDQVIDISPAGAEVSVLEHAVAFNRGIMAFSDQAQFYLGTKEGATTSTSFSADVTTKYTCSKEVPPAAVGSDIYFASDSGRYSTIWEYFVRDDTVTNDAANITGHVPNYVPANLLRLVPSANHDVIFAIPSTIPNRLYVYKYYWNGDEKSQSAWSYWEFKEDTSVLDGVVLDAHLYQIVARPTGTSVERLSLQHNDHPDELPYQIYLDRRVTLQGVYLPGEDKTEFVLPYTYSQSDLRLIHGSAFTTSEGQMIDPSGYHFTGDRTIKVEGDHSAGIVFAGYLYQQKFTFSEQFVTDSEGNAVNTGRLQIRGFTVYFVNTAYFRTVVDPYGDGSQTENAGVVPARLSDFTGKSLGSSTLLIGKPQFASGAYTFQVYAPATSAKVSIVNDSHVGSTFQKAEVELFYFNRARRR